MFTISHTQKTKLFHQERCPECRNQIFVTDLDTGEVICQQCGLVLEEILDQSPEWRTFEASEKKIRVGAPISLTLYDKGLSTTFQSNRDTHGRFLSIEKQHDMRRLKRWNVRAQMHSSTERNLSQAMNAMTLFADNLHIPEDIRTIAASIYRRALEKKLIRGRSIRSITAASLYAACRITQTPRSLKTLVVTSGGKQKEISRYYRLIQRELELKPPIDDPMKYISLIASKAEISQKSENLAVDLLQRASQVKVEVGKSPGGIAAATLYIAAIINHENITQKDLAKAANVTEVTIRNRYKELVQTLNVNLEHAGAS